MPRLPLFGGVGVYFCIMMELEELIREYEEGIALEMYHEMVDYIDNHGADITGRNVDYTLMKVISMSGRLLTCRKGQCSHSGDMRLWWRHRWVSASVFVWDNSGSAGN